MSDKLKIELSGMDDLRAEFSRVSQRKRDEFTRLVKSTALDVQRVAKRNSPYQFGDLRRSINLLDEAFDGLEVTVGSNLHYALPQESKNAYLFPAAMGEQAKFKERAKKILKS